MINFKSLLELKNYIFYWMVVCHSALCLFKFNFSFNFWKYVVFFYNGPVFNVILIKTLKIKSSFHQGNFFSLCNSFKLYLEASISNCDVEAPDLVRRYMSIISVIGSIFSKFKYLVLFQSTTYSVITKN